METEPQHTGGKVATIWNSVMENDVTENSVTDNSVTKNIVARNSITENSVTEIVPKERTDNNYVIMNLDVPLRHEF